MNVLRILLVIALAVSPAAAMERPSYHTKGSPTGKPFGPLKPGEYWWNPGLSPRGPVVVVVSIPLQTMHVYRNGILIGRSTVSTGAKGHGTPSGVFTILEKRETHRSKKYDNAPMPNMQRLTWTGIAMHSGNLPGYPASHGCIRLPYDFSQLLFQTTAQGGTVVIGDGTHAQPHLAANPGFLLAPKDFTPDAVKPLNPGAYQWAPERSPSGPITILVSAADKTLYVYRNGNIIGRAALDISGFGPLGGHVITLLDGVSNKPSPWAPGKQARRWMQVSSDDTGKRIDPEKLTKRVTFNPEFASKIYDEVGPGTTIIITDQAAVRKAAKDFTIISN